MRAVKDYESRQGAAGLVGLAEMLVADDHLGKTMLARIMLDAIKRLLDDAFCAEKSDNAWDPLRPRPAFWIQ